MTTLKLFAHKFAVATSLCMAMATTGCIADTGDEDGGEFDVNENAISNGKVFDVAPALVLGGLEQAVPNTPENSQLRARYKAVGVTNTNTSPADYWGIGQCTATLVGPRTALSSAHCIPKVNGQPPRYFQLDRKASIEIAETHARPWVKGAVDDVVVYVLKNSVNDIVPKPISIVPAKKDQDFWTVGYGQYPALNPDGSAVTGPSGKVVMKGNGTKRIRYHKVGYVNNDVFFSSLNEMFARHGDSGGPIFMSDPAGGDVLAGVNATSNAFPQLSNYAEWIYDKSKGDVRFYDPIPSNASHKREIRSNSGKCLTNVRFLSNNFLTMLPCNGSSFQKWDLQPAANGTYRIVVDGQCLTGGQPDSCVPNSPPVESTNEVRMGQCLASNLPSTCERHEVKSQDWVLSKSSNGKYSIHSLNGLKCLIPLELPWFQATVFSECSGSELQDWDLK